MSLRFSMKRRRKDDYCKLQFRWPDLKYRLQERARLGPLCIPRVDPRGIRENDSRAKVKGKSRTDNPWVQTACIQFPGASQHQGCSSLHQALLTVPPRSLTKTKGQRRAVSLTSWRLCSTIAEDTAGEGAVCPDSSSNNREMLT